MLTTSSSYNFLPFHTMRVCGIIHGSMQLQPVSWDRCVLPCRFRKYDKHFLPASYGLATVSYAHLAQQAKEGKISLQVCNSRAISLPLFSSNHLYAVWQFRASANECCCIERWYSLWPGAYLGTLSHLTCCLPRSFEGPPVGCNLCRTPGLSTPHTSQKYCVLAGE